MIRNPKAVMGWRIGALCSGLIQAQSMTVDPALKAAFAGSAFVSQARDSFFVPDRNNGNAPFICDRAANTVSLE
ncbi:MAG: hypothetical protein HS116_17680 [Planctomycetes bacterium]|nr:hypothetical protein [Planctomycetota bacterium]